MTIQQPTENRPRPNNVAPPAREDAEFEHDCPDCQHCRADGFRRGRSAQVRGWGQRRGMRWPVHSCQASMRPRVLGWPDIWQAIRQLITKAVHRG